MLEDDNKTISWALVTAKMPRQLLELDSFVSKVSAIVSLIFKSPSRAEGSESKQLKKRSPFFRSLADDNHWHCREKRNKIDKLI
jgi:hypothetical protein